MAVLRQAEGGVPYLSFAGSTASAVPVFTNGGQDMGGMDASMMSQMKALEDENRRLKRMYADLSMQADLLKEALEKMRRPSQRRELAGKAVAQRGVSVALACRTVGVSETCFRYSPKRNADNDEIADLLLGLVKVKKTWGFGLCFLHMRNV
jgi:putative transposase